MPVIRTKHAVFVLGAVFVAAPLSMGMAETVGRPPLVLAQFQQMTPQQQEEEKRKHQQKRPDEGGRQQGNEPHRGGGGGEQHRGGGDERRGGGGGGGEERQRRDFGQQPGGGGRPPQQDNDDDRRRGRGGDDRQRQDFGQRPPAGGGGGRSPQDDDQDKRRGEDRGRGDGRPPQIVNPVGPGGPDKGQPPQIGGRPPEPRDQDKRRGDDRGPGDGRPPQIGKPAGPGGPDKGQPPQIGGPAGPGGPDKGRSPQIGGRGIPGDRNDGGRAFEAVRPQFTPEDVRKHREERHEQSRGTLGDIVKQRHERRDEGGRIVIEEPDARRIVRGEGRVIIRHDESARFRRGRDFREERGPGNSRLTIIDRPGGIKIVTVVDNDGRLVRRSRRGPDGREFVLIDNSDWRGRNRRGYRRGGSGFDFFIDLPAPVVRIPRDRYYVYADRASEEDIEETLSAPPVEDIEPEYSLDEIRYSPRLRERMPSVNLNTINFEFGSWEIPDDQVRQLEVMARAIERILRRNPDEVFLIEGHTDAVGSDEDNLSLSDRRAESVARVLSDEYNIPPENLVTQGYGEQYLLVNTVGAERANRRVEFRRITPLLARGEQR